MSSSKNVTLAVLLLSLLSANTTDSGSGCNVMGRTIPSFRIALAMEKEEWKPFRNALDKRDRKEFDEMWELPKFYISACSNSVQYVRLHPILMSILLYHYK
jgi:hypothetical protein